MAWWDWNNPGPWKKHQKHVEMIREGLDVEPLRPDAAIIAAAKQVADDNHAMASMENDTIQATAHQRVAEAFEAFAVMLEEGPR